MSVGPRLYAVVAKKDGGTKMRFLSDFGFNSSPEGLMDKVRKRLVVDPAFLELSKGWIFCVMLADFLLKVEADGKTMMFQNDTEKLK